MSERVERVIIAEFGNPDALSDAARRMHHEGFKPLDALTPCPVEGLASQDYWGSDREAVHFGHWDARPGFAPAARNATV